MDILSGMRACNVQPNNIRFRGVERVVGGLILFLLLCIVLGVVVFAQPFAPEIRIGLFRSPISYVHLRVYVFSLVKVTTQP